MRPVLFHIPLDRPWHLGPLGDVPGFGFGIVLLAWVLFGIALTVLRYRATNGKLTLAENALDIGQWLFVAALIVFGAPALGAYLKDHGTAMWRDGLPVFGYGLMLCTGFYVAIKFAEWRAVKEGLSGDRVWDMVTWLIVPGILGARLFYLIQYRDKVFGSVPPSQWIYNALNFSQGGIILYGALIAGAAGYFSFCYRNRIRPLGLADIIVPSIFIGIGFGRIGCFLYGCCYGRPTSLPWAVSFPRESAAFNALVEKDVISESAICTPWLHPTQIYSSIDGFLIAAITAWYFWRRRRNGEVLAVALILYPVTRFCEELLRGDEPGQFATSLTISQWISIGLFLSNFVFMFYLSKQPAKRDPIILPEPTGGPQAALQHATAHKF